MYYHRTVTDLGFSVGELTLKLIMVYEKNKYRNNIIIYVLHDLN